jgi:MoaA/NifB/PqqE/SkfB family radical SAM enzyme
VRLLRLRAGQDTGGRRAIRRCRRVFPGAADPAPSWNSVYDPSGGEPLVHPDIVRLVSQTAAAGISCAVITNGWFLPRHIGSLAAAGLSRLIVSIDSAELAEHERNRGLEGLERCLAEGIAQARACGLPVQASVTVSRLVRYDALPDTLRRLGFESVSFLSAPRALRRRDVCVALKSPPTVAGRGSR